MFRRRIVIEGSDVGGGVLKGFPVLVCAAGPDLRSVEHGGHVSQSRGGEVHFVTADGVRLPHEVEAYDAAGGALRAWVRLPELSAAADTGFYVCYGGPVASGAADRAAVWDETYRLVLHDANSGETHGDADDGFGDAVTVEAWIEKDGYQAEALQAVVSKWGFAESLDRFSGYDASQTDGLDTRGYYGAVCDGRYVYFSPEQNGDLPVDGHGRVLRFDTHGDFHDAGSWSAYDAGNTDGLNTKGYYGAIATGRYIFFVPRQDHTEFRGGCHERMLRYDRLGDFKDPASWSAYDVGADVTHQGAAFDGRYIYFAPGYKTEEPNMSGEVLRYDTEAALKDANSYAVYDVSDICGANLTTYDGAVFDGRYVYFVPLNSPQGMLRYDTTGGFTDKRSWQSHDASRVSGLEVGMFVGATFDGRFIYYVPYGSGVCVRFDTHGGFSDAGAWSAYDTQGTSGLDAKGFDGGVFDGRYVYLIPFWNGTRDPNRVGLHGQMVRYDASGEFTDPASWQATDAGSADGVETVGYNGAAFDGRFIYCAPWCRAGLSASGGANAHGRVLRYDTTGAGASFSLRCVDFGSNGGLCAALAGPSFLVNTERYVLTVRADRNLSPGRHHLAGVYDGRRVRLYIDGVLAAEEEGKGTIQNCGAVVAVGGLENALGRFEGRVSEVRVSPAARGAEWIATEVRNQSSPTAFCRIGPEERV